MDNDYYQPVDKNKVASSKYQVANSDQPQTLSSPDVPVPNAPIGVSTDNSTPLATPPMQSDDKEEAKNLVQDAVEQIVSDMGYEEASDEQKKQLFETIEKRVSLAILKALMANIAPEEAQTLAKKIESGEPIDRDIEKIVKDNPSANSAISKAVADLYEKMLQESKDVWDAVGKKDQPTPPAQDLDANQTSSASFSPLGNDKQ